MKHTTLDEKPIGRSYRQTPEERLAISFARTNHYVSEMVEYQKMYWKAAGFPVPIGDM